MNAPAAAPAKRSEVISAGLNRRPPTTFSSGGIFHKNSNLFKLLNFLLGSNFHPEGDETKLRPARKIHLER